MQEQKHQNKNEDEVEEVSANTETNVDSDEIDDLLADIDDVLEENAEEFVMGFVQKGGE